MADYEQKCIELNGQTECSRLVSAHDILRKYEVVSAHGRDMLKPVPGTSEVIGATNSEDIEKYRGELQAYAYIVDLDEATVSPAKQ